MSDTYILQKDLPYAKKGKVYTKVESGYYHDMSKPFAEIERIHPMYVENNPEWFKKKENEPPKWAKDYHYHTTIDCSVENNIAWFGEPQLYLNGEQFVPISEVRKTLFTKNDLEKAFEAARKTKAEDSGQIHFNDGSTQPHYLKRFENFEDYMTNGNK